MTRRTIPFACVAMVLVVAALAPVASAQAVITGTVVRVEPGSQTIVLDNGQTLRLERGTQLVVNGQPVLLETLQPGTIVTVQSVQPAVPRQVTTGVVTDVDRNGKVTIKSNDGDKFDVWLSPSIARQIRKGDPVTMDLSFGPAAQPAALPR